MGAIELLMLDLDGTLVDTLSANYAADCRIIRDLGGAVPSLDEYRSNPYRGNWDDFYAFFGVRDHVSALSRFYREVDHENLVMIPHVDRTIREISALPMGMIVISMTKDKGKIKRKLRSSGLHSFFPDESLVAVASTKSPAFIALARERGIPPKKMLYVGDTARDVEDSRTAGVKIAVVANQYSFNPVEMLRASCPDYFLERFEDLKYVLRGA